ncbi:MAG: hypothetical protein H7A47_17760 [Verrucomicrobiales bacterium]|nr:hypothetical protein [Verrucomicrobiales bacterium]
MKPEICKPRIVEKLILAAIINGALGFRVAAGQVATASFEAPDWDQWVYHRLSGTQAGAWEDAALFTKREVSGSEEDRAAGYHATYNLTNQIPAGLGVANYKIQSARLTVEVVEVNPAVDGEGNLIQEVVYDPTYDSWRTHLRPTATNYATDYVADADAGRSICLFGFGLTNGFTQFSFDDNGGVGTAAPLYNEFSNPMVQTAPPFARNAFPLAFDTNGLPMAVNNNVYDQVEANPWAVATIAGKSSGAVIAEGDVLVFDLNVSHPGIQAYLQQALHAGQVGLVVSSLHHTPVDGFLRVATNESFDKHGASLELTYTAGPRLLSLEIVNQHAVLRFTGNSGQTFQIHRSGSLTGWETVTAPTLTFPEAGVAEWTDPNPAADQKFYRVSYVTP